ncbi:hypothetical protein P8452_75940 [Trifolium repens]|nr:hypothetical protein P8452_75940 [Trifolium repens]
MVLVDIKSLILILCFISRFELVCCFICYSILCIVSFSSNHGAYFGNCIKVVVVGFKKVCWKTVCRDR